MSTNFPDMPNDSAACCKLVRSAIEKRLITANFGDDPMRFLPDSAFSEVADHQIIDQILMSTVLETEVRSSTVGKLMNGGKRIFATCIWGSLPPLMLRDILANVGDRLDKALPLAPGSFPASFPQENVQNFINAQWFFLAPQFIEGKFTNLLSEETQIPIQYSTGDSLGKGAEAEVFNAEIMGDQQIPGFTKSFALKMINNPREENGEHITLEKFSGTTVLQHLNIASIHSGFQFKGKLYLIAERADSGSLETYMENNRSGAQSLLKGQGKEWLSQQMRGLAAALTKIHTGVPGFSITHHDIKPDNILVHSQPDVMFKITDWGCSSVEKYIPKLIEFRKEIDDAESGDFCRPDEPGILLDVVTRSLSKLETSKNENWRSEVRVIRDMLATDPRTRISAAAAADKLG
ncbi:kinase-like domain-containing protein [Ampelomyces quisqualis]|uniref:Kinase-like domain-containing protein n=1 Tax=Ampelomyces quisqualis TaxID=50730 RepID=A0A6A5R0Y7_AMPQU|nr:kinase-like domain-containing protein [Ampelomyces quisqualis]